MNTFEHCVDLVHPGSVSAMVFTADGETLVTTTRQYAKRKQVGLVKLWNVLTAKEITTFHEVRQWAWSMSLSPKTNTVAVGGYKEVKIWDLTTNELLTTLKGYVGMVRSVAFMPDGKTLFTTGRDARAKQLFRWDLTTGQCQASGRGHHGGLGKVAVSLDGSLLATGGYSEVKFWDTTSDTEVARIETHADGFGMLYSLAFAPEGTFLATGGANGRIKLWSVPSEELMATLKGHRGSVWTLAFSADGKTLASGSTDTTVRLWNVSTGEERARLQWHAHVCAVAFSPDGQTLAVGGEPACGENAVVQLWRLHL